MKTHPWTLCAAAGSLGWLLLLGGCSSEPSSAPPLTKVVVTNPPAPTTPPPASAPAPVTTNAVAATNAPTAAAPTAPLPPQRIPLPPAVDAVADLAQSQVGEMVILEYVKKSPNVFDLTADQIIYLKDIGLSDQVIATMMARSQELRAAGAVPSPGAPAASTAANAPAPTEPAPTQPAAAPEYASAPPAPDTATLAQPDSTAAAAAAVYQQPVTQVNNNYFYTALSPYGSWVEMPGYGWCWRPTVAVVDTTWQPYAQGGRWVYTDSGWYWQSSYSWGWAAFHYGNWYRSPACGWVWVPGYTWAPAWVTWRYTDDYCGWAPLPPGCGWNTGVGLTYYGAGVSVGFSFGLGYDCFTFVSYRNFCDPHPYRHCLPRQEMRRAYDHSVVHNEYDHRNNSVVNRGIAPSRITAVTRSEIRKVELRDVTREPNAPQRAERLEREGRELAVYRPQPGATPGNRPAPVSRHSVEPVSGSPRNLADNASRMGAPMSTREVRPANPTSPATTAPTSRTRAEAPPTRNNAPITIQAPNRTTANSAPPGTANNPSTRSRGEVSTPQAPANQPFRTEVNRSSRGVASPTAPAGSTAAMPAPNASRTAPPVSRSEPAGRSAGEARTATRESIRNEPMKLEAPTSVNVAPPKYANGANNGGGYPGGNAANPVARPMTRDPGYGAPVGAAPRNAPAAGPAPAPNRSATGPSGPTYAPPQQRGPAPGPAPQPAQSAPANGNNGGRGNNRVQPN